MQTKTRFDPPRNRASYAIPDGKFRHWQKLVARKWDFINRAEYHIWCASKLSPSALIEVNRTVERKQHLAAARYLLSLARAANDPIAGARPFNPASLA